jgi:hypothetical protein
VRSLRMLGIISLFALFAATPHIGAWVATANASTGSMPSRAEMLNAPANDNDDEICDSGNPRKQKKCHYNSADVDNDNDGDGDVAPSLEVSVSNADPKEGDSFSVTLHAWGNEIDQVWWWVPDVISDNGNDNDSWLADSHVANCDGADDCSRSSELTAQNSGTIYIHSKARDRFGRETGEVVTEVRVHDD